MNAIRKVGYLFMAAIVQSIIKATVSLFPLKKNKYFCISMNGLNYGDNIKCMSDYIEINNSNSQIVWGFDANYFKSVDCRYKKVKTFSFMYYFHILTSKYIICNFAMDFRFLRKRKGQIFLQTWHGTALKRIGYDMYKSEKQDIFYRWFKVDRIKDTTNNADIWLSGSKFMTGVFRKSFRYTKEISEIGTPRNDIFFQNRPDVIKKIRDMYNIGDKKILLYAPTFRQDFGFTYYDVDLNAICSYWEQKMGKQYVVMVRLHPNMLRKKDELSLKTSRDIINVSTYPDMQELLYATDVLVTDYSSSMFDYMYLRRPVIMYVPDYNIYNRGFYMDIHNLPFIIIKNNEEIESKLSHFDEIKYIEKLNGFISNIGSVENGNATTKCYELLMQMS